MCQVQRASRKPQRATKALTALCESGATCKPQAATRNQGREALCESCASRNRTPQGATMVNRRYASEVQGATANRKPQREPAIVCASPVQGAAASRTPQRQRQGSVRARRNVQPQAASRNRGHLGCSLRLAACTLRLARAGSWRQGQRGLRLADASCKRNPQSATEGGKNQRTLGCVAWRACT